MATLHQAAVRLADIPGKAGLTEVMAVLPLEVRVNKKHLEEM
jgi:hypothetical protein